jgi:hypothetical protein
MKRKTSHPRNLPQILLLEQLAVKKKSTWIFGGPAQSPVRLQDRGL